MLEPTALLVHIDLESVFWCKLNPNTWADCFVGTYEFINYIYIQTKVTRPNTWADCSQCSVGSYEIINSILMQTKVTKPNTWWADCSVQVCCFLWDPAFALLGPPKPASAQLGPPHILYLPAPYPTSARPASAPLLPPPVSVVVYMAYVWWWKQNVELTNLCLYVFELN